MTTSITGRKLRKDSLESRFGLQQIRELIEIYYVDKLMSAEATAKAMTAGGVPIGNDAVLMFASRFGIRRSKAMAISLGKARMSRSSLWNNEIESISDGMVIGDGSITVNHATGLGRVGIGSVHEEFALYCQSLLSRYQAKDPHYSPGVKGKGMWGTFTLHHIDFYEQYLRWYPGGKKDVPADIRFTPMMLTLWHLGDGCLSSPLKGNARYMYFSTNSFTRNALENIVVPKFAEIGVAVKRITDDNRVFIATRSIVTLLKFMGGKSPVKCFDYKFDIEDWQTLATMKQAAAAVDLNYHRLANWVKHDIIDHSRSPGGKKVLFTPDQLNELERRVISGELPREAGLRHRAS